MKMIPIGEVLKEQGYINEESKDSYIRRERHYGEFTRNFYIVNVDEEQICAEFKEGVLKVTMPKEKIENSKKIL